MSSTSRPDSARSDGLEGPRSARRAPAPVTAATVVLYLYILLLVLIGVLALLAIAGSDTTASEDRSLSLAGISFLAIGAVLAVLGYQLVRGRRWALAVMMILLWANAVQAIVRSATGFLNVGLAVLITLLLLLPRSSREHFGMR
jgi:hypothetical protein